MKINSSAGLEHYQNYQKKLKDGERAQKGMPSTAANTDKVTISGSAAAHAEAARIAPALAAEVEGAALAERVDALRQAVQDGSYHVPSEEIADAMLDRLA